MDSPALTAATEPTPTPEHDDVGPANAVLAHVQITWDGGHADAAVVHAARTMLVLEAIDPAVVLPPMGEPVVVDGAPFDQTARMAEHGRNGRFLVALGERPVRRSLRLRVSLPGKLRSASDPQWTDVEIADLATGGARVRGVELPVGSQITLAFTPPGRSDVVTVRALVAHGTRGAQQPWIGVRFRLVALRGGR